MIVGGTVKHTEFVVSIEISDLHAKGRTRSSVNFMRQAARSLAAFEMVSEGKTALKETWGVVQKCRCFIKASKNCTRAFAVFR